MTEPKHTPGPWEVRQRGNDLFDMGWDITPSPGIRGQFEYEADARKSAASPEMLDVLERINAGDPICSHASHWRGVVDDWDVHTDLCKAMNAAIAKAKGEPCPTE